MLSADLPVIAAGRGQGWMGSLVRSGRLAKYNQPLRFEEKRGNAAHYPGRGALRE